MSVVCTGTLHKICLDHERHINYWGTNFKQLCTVYAFVTNGVSFNTAVSVIF